MAAAQRIGLGERGTPSPPLGAERAGVRWGPAAIALRRRATLARMLPRDSTARCLWHVTPHLTPTLSTPRGGEGVECRRE